MKEYFVVLTPQEGQTKPAYTFAHEETLKSLKKQNAVAWSKEVEPKNIRTPEEVEELLKEYESSK